MIEAGHVIEIMENSPATHEDVRELVAKRINAKYQRYSHVTRQDAEDVGEAIQAYAFSWFGMLARAEESFPGGLLARFMSLVDWSDVGRYYLNRYIEDRAIEEKES